MHVEEIVIHHALYGVPSATRVSSDGKKLYFLDDGHLKYVEAPKGDSFNGMSDDVLHQIVIDELLIQKKSH